MIDYQEEYKKELGKLRLDISNLISKSDFKLLSYLDVVKVLTLYASDMIEHNDVKDWEK